ncbi:AI-2E family transporter [Halomarina ordinaria]|uniref:AI-2E family transporter n=1 Tax=Halomarina ordinaria TaxID=3033939 RepID=A0ABD5U449_9EURY|nr:AI-2E family transporter [Halomarina sp. PSRA2]
MDPPSLDRSKVAWVVVGVALAGAFALVVYSFVGTFIFGLFVYYATRPVYERLKRRIYPPSLAALVSLFVLALPALSLFAYVVAVGIQEYQRLSVREGIDLGPLEPLIRPYIDVSYIVEDPQTLLNDPTLRDFAQQAFNDALGYLGFIGNALLHVFVVLALAFYLLRDGGRFSRWFYRRFDDRRGILRDYCRAVDTDLASIFFGNILNAVFTGIIGAVSYTLLNEVVPGQPVPYPTLLGLLTGAASLIPVVGMKLVYFPLTGYLLVQQYTTGGPLWFVVLFFAVSFVVVDSVPDFVLRPYVSGRNLHIGMVMFAYIFGPLLFGWYGIFLGPVLLVFIYHFATLVLPELLSEGSVRPYSVDPGVLPRSFDLPEGSPVETATVGDDPDPDRATDPSGTPGDAPHPTSNRPSDGD